MAAVLCGAIGKACTGCFDCIGTVCMLPFKVCGACCEGCGQCCQHVCESVSNCCSSSFCCYITVTLVLNLPPIVIGLMDLPNLISGCSGTIWLFVFWVLCVVHILAAFYMAWAVDNDESLTPSAEQANDISHLQRNAQNGAGRIKDLFCYDMWMAVYILLLFGCFGWLLLGAVWLITGTMNSDEDDETCDDAHGNAQIAFAFGWAFFFVGGCALCCSLCCGVFNSTSTNRWSGARLPQQQQQQQQQQFNTPASGAAAAAQSTNAAAKKEDSKHLYSGAASSNNNATPVTPSAPPESEIPVASAIPIYGDGGNLKS